MYNSISEIANVGGVVLPTYEDARKAVEQDEQECAEDI
jgi:hypothetical protein